jgi:hypothetical protein
LHLAGFPAMSFSVRIVTAHIGRTTHWPLYRL